MTYETYRLIFLGAAVASVVLFILAITLFFILKIPSVIGDLSGSTARKAIQNIRAQNEQSGDKRHKVSAVNQSRGKITDKILPSGRLEPSNAAPLGTGVVTDKLNTASLVPDETTLLESAGETTLLQPAGGTTLLVQDEGNETTLLTDVFAVVHEIAFIHTDEVIE